MYQYALGEKKMEGGLPPADGDLGAIIVAERASAVMTGRRLS